MLESARGIRKPLADSSLLLQKDGMLFRYSPPPSQPRPVISDGPVSEKSEFLYNESHCRNCPPQMTEAPTERGRTRYWHADTQEKS